MAIGALITGIIFATGTGSEGTTSSPPTNTPPPSTPPPIIVSARDLISAYEENEVAADAQYEDRILMVTGSINNIGKDIVDDPYIVLTTGGEWDLGGVQCMFKAKDEATLAQLSTGQTVTIQGKCSGQSILNVLLRNCVLK